MEVTSGLLPGRRRRDQHPSTSYCMEWSHKHLLQDRHQAAGESCQEELDFLFWNLLNQSIVGIVCFPYIGIASAYIMLMFALLFSPIVVIGAILGIKENNSNALQRGWTLAWLVGENILPFLFGNIGCKMRKMRLRKIHAIILLLIFMFRL
ncbi:hypothetical protein BJ878DRAFT_1967 [Calycina marina]|uniref:Uncharacterized protein n=1 Tax=Calycina marina TaxID=1763456 RepID=A0A9P7ZBU5_9HELO|nr:hypothetical protein BJ878DRAFT_1967 [Calycina marina]